jgi:hypothetical protein
MKRVLILSLAAILLLAGSSFAFDGNRKGFVLGGGLGLGATGSWKVDVPFFGSTVSVDENGTGVGLHFVIGGAFDEYNVLVYEGNAIGYNSDMFDEGIGQGFNGAAWYHYFGEAGKSAFTTLGLGLYYFKVGDFDATDPKVALLVGGGYEFARHWQVGGYFSFGQTSEGPVDFDHTHFNILVSGIAF